VAVSAVRTLLICHAGDTLNHQCLARWLASFSDYQGAVVISERGGRLRQRVRREIERIGFWRFLDVLAFRLYYRAFLAAKDRAWEQECAERLSRRFSEIEPNASDCATASPNSTKAQAFIEQASPDIIVARCKTLLAERIFTIARTGTFVMHPGICPEYRNAHGCFWALARRDLKRVGMTLLRIDKGVDTGPVFGYFGCDYDEARESHIVIQHRTMFDNLDAIRQLLECIYDGQAVPLDTSGRESRAWGQPWLTRYLAWKRAARQ
jgi:hypothetical protein